MVGGPRPGVKTRPGVGGVREEVSDHRQGHRRELGAKGGALEVRMAPRFSTAVKAELLVLVMRIHEHTG